MSFISWLRNLKGILGRDGRIQGPEAGRVVARRYSFVPLMEALEDRALPSTFTVLNLHDSGPGSLRAEIAAANATAGANTIDFADHLHGTIALTSGELLITQSVTINGPGENLLAVSGNNAGRVFEMAPGLNVGISGLTITQGFALEQGGGILNDGSNLTLSGDVLSQNVAVGSATNDINGGAVGGALDSASGTLDIVGCQISNNQALGGASAVGNAIGGGIEILAGSATVSDSLISGNLARGADNSSNALGQSGGIDLEAGTLIVSNSTVSGNLAIGGNGGTGEFGGDSEGGAISSFGTASFSGSAFAGNQSLAGNGGTGELAGEGLGGVLYAGGAVTIAGCTFSANLARGGNSATGEFVGEGSGGALFLFGPGPFAISASGFDHNLAIGGNADNSGAGTPGPFIDYAFGGAIDLTSASLSASNTTFSHNQAIGGNNGTATGTDILGVGGAEGGAVYNEVYSVAGFTACTFDHNQAQGGNGNSGTGAAVLVGEGLGGAIVSGYGALSAPNTLTVNNSTITQNNATGGNNNSGNATVAGLVGAGAGAGIANYAGGTASVTGSDLDHNQASGGHHNTASGSGVVIANLGAGGGIFNYLSNFNSSVYGQLTVSVVTITDCVLDLNQAQGGDGGNGEGGGIADVLNATTTVSSSIVTLNQALAGAGDGLGGGAYNDATSTLTLIRDLMTLNQANGALGIGGGIYTPGTFSIDNQTIILFNVASTSGNNTGT